MGQLSFFSADAHERALTDLEGVLCGRGQVVVFGSGTTARLSLVLGAPPPPPAEEDEDDHDDQDDEPTTTEQPAEAAAPTRATTPVDPDDLAFLDLDPDELAAALAPAPAEVPVTESVHTDQHGAVGCAPHDPVAEWRARALCCAFRGRGVDAELHRAPDGRPVVRSAFRADLVDLARRWTRGAVKAVPGDFELDGPRLRLWVLAAGRRAGRAYLLGLDPHAEHTHEAMLTASRRAGLGATLGGDRADPVLRIVGRRRHGRLGELVGAPPRDLVEGIWPG